MNAPSDFVRDDKWAGLVLKANGNTYLTDWGEWVDYGPDFFPDVPEIEVTQLLPEGSVKVGVLGDSGIFDCLTHEEADGGFRIEVVEVARWQDIEILPPWGQG